MKRVLAGMLAFVLALGLCGCQTAAEKGGKMWLSQGGEVDYSQYTFQFELPEKFTMKQGSKQDGTISYSSPDGDSISVTAAAGSDIFASDVTEEEVVSEAQETFSELLGSDFEIKNVEFSTGTIDGCPSYQIFCSMEVLGAAWDQMVICVNGDKLYTFTYSNNGGGTKTSEMERWAESIRAVPGSFDSDAFGPILSEGQELVGYNWYTFQFELPEKFTMQQGSKQDGSVSYYSLDGDSISVTAEEEIGTIATRVSQEDFIKNLKEKYSDVDFELKNIEFSTGTIDGCPSCQALCSIEVDGEPYNQMIVFANGDRFYTFIYTRKGADSDTSEMERWAENICAVSGCFEFDEFGPILSEGQDLVDCSQYTFQFELPDGFTEEDASMQDGSVHYFSQDGDIIQVTAEEAFGALATDATEELLVSVWEKNLSEEGRPAVKLENVEFSTGTIDGCPCYKFFFSAEASGKSVTLMIVGVNGDRLYTFYYLDNGAATKTSEMERWQESIHAVPGSFDSDAFGAVLPEGEG